MTITVEYVGADGAERTAADLEAADDRLSARAVAVDAVDGRADCVVTDHDPPAVDGLALLGRLGERDPGVPVVVYASGGSEAVASEAVSAGAADYLPADAGVDRLADRVVAAVDRARQRRGRRRAADRLEAFASAVNHDLRNPLNVAMGRLQMVAEECDSDQVPVVARSLRDLEALIEGSVAFARAGDPVTDTESVALRRVAEGCWETLGTRGVTLSVETDATVDADPERLRTLFVELLENAVVHGGQGVVTVDDHATGFHVADDGPGLSGTGADVDRVTSPGYAAGETAGAGFGLATAAEAATAHGWDLQPVTTDDGLRVEVHT